jgi:hypothetical protein
MNIQMSTVNHLVSTKFLSFSWLNISCRNISIVNFSGKNISTMEESLVVLTFWTCRVVAEVSGARTEDLPTSWSRSWNWSRAGLGELVLEMRITTTASWSGRACPGLRRRKQREAGRVSRSRDPLRPTYTGIPPSTRERTAAMTAGEDDGETAGGGRPWGSSTSPLLLEGPPPLLEPPPATGADAAGRRGCETSSGTRA